MLSIWQNFFLGGVTEKIGVKVGVWSMCWRRSHNVSTSRATPLSLNAFRLSVSRSDVKARSAFARPELRSRSQLTKDHCKQDYLQEQTLPLSSYARNALTKNFGESNYARQISKISITVLTHTTGAPVQDLIHQSTIQYS